MLLVVVSVDGKIVLLTPVSDGKAAVGLFLEADFPSGKLSLMQFLFSAHGNLLKMNRPDRANCATATNVIKRLSHELR